MVGMDFFNRTITLDARSDTLSLKRRGLLRGTDWRQLYSRRVSQTPLIRSPGGLRLLGLLVRRMLLTSGLDAARHFTSPAIAGDNRQRI